MREATLLQYSDTVSSGTELVLSGFCALTKSYIRADGMCKALELYNESLSPSGEQAWICSTTVSPSLFLWLSPQTVDF
jgi:hypothetical protein